MIEFFRGWKRKVGVLALVVALALMTAWVRSSMIADALVIISNGRPMLGIVSIDHYFAFVVSKSNIELGWPVWEIHGATDLAG